MAKSKRPDHFVVDGSNIATEGRGQPSLEQLNEAVLAFMDEHHGAMISVVVDATFGHRIAKKEVKAFDEAVANNELVTPPAGAIGRGDAFVLSIAHKASAGVLSNDSFQEFHGDYDWLFDEGRLIGGKPVPHVGWVFVARTPVRGPKSRKSVRAAKSDESTDKAATKQEANRRVRAKKPTSTDADEPKLESPSRRRRSRRGGSAGDAPGAESPPQESAGPKDHVNELMPFLDFVEHHPVGTSCTAVVESYASHGAYARMGDVLIYLPLRLMEDPTPRSARSVLSIGESVTVVVVGFTPDRRSIDAALPHMAGDIEAASADSAAERPTTASKGTTRKSAAKKTTAKKTTAKKTTAKRATAKKTAAKKAPAAKSPVKKAASKKPVKKTAAKKTAAKKTATKKTATKKAATTKAAAKQSAKKSSTRKTATRKRTAPKKTSSRSSSTTSSASPESGSGS